MSLWIVHKTTVNPGCEQQAIDGWAQVGSSMKDEPGLLFWKVLKSGNEPRTFYVIEAFTDMDAVDHHCDQPYVAEAVQLFQGLVDGEMSADGPGLKTMADFTELVVDAK